jgi:gamma-glutamyltranspeptidase/glutathione hydrolase
MTELGFNRSRFVIDKTEIVSHKGLVVAQHPLAAQAGAQILAEGGNAVDAAVAAAAAVTVVEPSMSSLAGGGAMMIHVAQTRQNVAIDFLPRVPSAARPDMYRLAGNGACGGMFGWPQVEADANTVGALSVGVPGTMAGLCMALERHGTFPLSKIFQPAIELAETGFPADWYLCTMIAGAARTMRRFPGTEAVFLPDGLVPAPLLRTYLESSRFRQPDLARTLQRLAAGGVDEFTRGEVGRAIVRTMQRMGGLITEDDLVAYRAHYHDTPIETQYRDTTLYSVPGANGAATVFETLNILEQFDLKSLSFLGADHLHWMACAQRAAFLDRFAHLADPSKVHVPLSGLLSKDFAIERAKLVALATAGPDAAGDPWPIQGSRPAQDSRGRGPLNDSGCTTHICVADAMGNLVSLTNTLGDLWGSYVVAEGTGMLLNDSMIWFNPVPGHINSIEPGKVPLSNISTILGSRNGNMVLAIGAPGGRKVITSVLQSIVNHLEFGQSLQRAIAAPRLHCEGERLHIDSRIDAGVLSELVRRGHRIDVLEESFVTSNFARPVGIAIDPDSRALRSGVDAMRMASAVGLT